MGPALAIFISLLFLSTAFLGTAWGLSFKLVPEHQRREHLQWLLKWSVKGIVIPLALWTLMNLGISWNLQPFMPAVQIAKNRGAGWLSEFLRVFGTGTFVVSSYWTALTLGWTLARTGLGLEGEPRSNFKALCLTCFIGILAPAAGIVVLGGWPVLGLAATAMLAPAAAYAPSILHLKKLPPMYSRAIARMKFGKYTEAELEIIHELEKSEDDFEGWIMLAGLYAEQFKDLAEAEQTILEICTHPRVTPSQISIALHKLADWRLRLGSDPDAARRALQMICDRLPGTHLAHMAQLRINQLPETAEELREQRSSRPIPLPSLGDHLFEEDDRAETSLDTDEAAELANACVEKLERDPNNVAAREKLARLFAERLNQPELGLEQVTLLLNMPDQEDAKRAEWLSLAAAWHIKYRQDLDIGRKTLERIIREFPQSPQAFAARRRLQTLDVDFRG